MDNIILIGFMGCGKTSVGIRLSYRFRKTFIDTDKWIEKQGEMTVSEIFEKYGEEEFRDRETNCLKQFVSEAHNQIIAVGGGLPIRAENRILLRKIGKVIYLRVSPEVVCDRLSGDTTRPLLSGNNPQEKVRKLLEERKSLYEDAADMIIDVDNKSFETIITEIAENIQKGEGA